MTATQCMTAEELWAMPEVPGRQFELVNGELVEMAGAGALHGLVVELVVRVIGAFARQHRLGLTFPDNTGYVLRRDPDLVRIPDASFVSRQRVPAEGVPEGFWMIPPDLAIEIVSPGDQANDVHDKVHDYLDAGVRAVWVLWPRHRSMTTYTQNRVVRELGPDDELDGGDVLPDFRVRVSDMFAVELTP